MTGRRLAGRDLGSRFPQVSGVNRLAERATGLSRKRRKKRQAPPPPPATRLDERLTTLDLDKLERELAQFLEKKARPKESPHPPEPEATVSHRHLDVPEAEVTIVRHTNAVRPEPRAAKPEPEPAIVPPPPTLRREHAPRAAFERHVEEATVVIIRRTTGSRSP